MSINHHCCCGMNLIGLDRVEWHTGRTIQWVNQPATTACCRLDSIDLHRVVGGTRVKCAVSKLSTPTPAAAVDWIGSDFILHQLYFAAQLVRGFTLSDRLDQSRGHRCRPFSPPVIESDRLPIPPIDTAAKTKKLLLAVDFSTSNGIGSGAVDKPKYISSSISTTTAVVNWIRSDGMRSVVK